MARDVDGNVLEGIQKLEPQDAGMNPGCLNKIADVLEEELSNSSFPGAVCLVGRYGKLVYSHCCGTLSLTRSQPVSFETVYDLASVTKPLTAALMSLLLIEEGRLSLLQNVQEFFPGQELPHLDGVTLKHLITHTSGLPAWVDLYSDTQTRDEAIEKLLKLPLQARPGERYEYSCLGYILLGVICEKVAGCSIQEYLKERIWKRLEMHSTAYNPPDDWKDFIASTAGCPARIGQELIGQVHDGNAWRMNGVSGNAGLFSNAPDLFRFCQAILDSDARKVLSRLGRERYLTDQVEGGVGFHSFGWFCTGNGMLPSGDLLPPGTIGHTGYTGTCILLIPQEQLSVILLTNRVCTDPEAVRIRRTRRRVANLVAAAI